MATDSVLLFRKSPVSLTYVPDSLSSTISAGWCQVHGVRPSLTNRVYGFLTLQSATGSLYMHLNLALVADGAFDLTLSGPDIERFSALKELGEQIPHESVPLFLSRVLLQREFHRQSPWLHVTESIIHDALCEVSRPLLVALLNKMQMVLARPTTAPIQKTDVIDAILSVYRCFLELCRGSDPHDLCALLGLSVELDTFSTPLFIHSVFSLFFGPGICQKVLRLHRETYAPSLSDLRRDSMLDSLRLMPRHDLRQILTTAGCSASSNVTKELATALNNSFLLDVATLRSLTDDQLLLFLMTVKPDISVSDVVGQEKDALHDLFLRSRFGSYLVTCFRVPYVLFPDLMKAPRHSHAEHAKVDDDAAWADTVSSVEKNWPSLPSRSVIHACMVNYRNALEVKAAIVCAVCSRQSHRLSVAGYCLTPKSILQECFSLLQSTDPHLQKYFRSSAASSANVKLIRGAILDTRGIVNHADVEVVQICKDCAATLLCNKIPRHSLANNLYLGELPVEFYDVTWAEEQICALFRLHAYIIRIFASEEAHRKLFGNTCAFPQNTVSTATALPRTPADVTGNITVVFIGSHKPTTAELLKYKHYTVRRGLVWRLLLYFHEFHLYYQGLPPPCPDLVSAYPEYGLLPGFEDRIIWDRESDPKAVFEQETAGMSAHPATEFAASAPDEKHGVLPFYLECTGVIDPNLQNIPARHLEQAALSNLAKSCSPEAVLTTAVKPPGAEPDLLVSRGNQPISDYNNPGLFPGMFPTLFPLGIGGFEDPFRPVKLKFLTQAEYFLDLATRSFRRHPTYLFAALNIHQRREVNLRTHLAISRQHFRRVAPRLNAVTSATLEQLATRIEQENWASKLSSKETEAMFLFRQVNTIAAKIPGSEAMKSHLRGNIRAYFQFFGTAHLFLTINPSPIHSPVFHFMVGDHSIDLTTQYPILPSRHVRALRVAEDPMEAADFFQWSLEILYEHLFGWDRAKQRSRPEGGILGHLQAFYIINELTERGFFHAHGLLWLLGAPNPSELHARLSCPEFQRKFFEFYESIIFNHFPDVDVCMPASYNCSQELPPRPPSFDTIADDQSPAAQRWQQRLDYETKICAVDCQLHKCRPVCHKYKNDGICRFNFPQEVVPQSHYDPERHAVVMRLLDPWVNFYNPIIIAFCRHNHDLKCMLSGRACRAGMIYITNYITKMEFKTQHALSLLSKAVVAAQGVEGSSVRQAQVLLQKCLTQFNRRQQVHAQQACRYIRGHNDALPSHKMLPLLSHLLLASVGELYPELIEQEKRSDVYVPLIRAENGRFRETSQIEDYFYRGDSLADMNFYDFVRLTECVRKSEKGENKDSPTATCSYVELKREHQLAATHHLRVQRESVTPFCGNVRVPIMVGSFPPRQNSAKFPLFVAAHFKPFGPDMPLAENMEELSQVLKNYTFNHVAQTVMKNWEAFHECEDERDADRLRKRERRAHVTVNELARWDQKDVDYQDSVVFDISSVKQTNTRLEQIGRELVATFHLANWFETQPSRPVGCSVVNAPEKTYELSSTNIKQWLHTLTEADKAAKLARRAVTTSSTCPPRATIEVNKTMVGTSELESKERKALATVVVHESQGQDVKQIESHLIEDFRLNERQTVAFKIIASEFLNRYVHKQDTTEPPFNLLLTGPGGTGKSHVIKALKNLMKHYGLGHAIRLLAPTGSTASVISGMTIHSGLKIGFKTSRIEGEDAIRIQYTTSVTNRRLLREEFKDAKVIFIDEVSLIPQELVAEVDAALREATETDQWMGGLMIIYAGDFGQYPPVGGTPLYHPIRSGIQAQSAAQIKARLGRLVWKQVNAVMSLSEQERMKGDAEYAAAVSRLRLRCCIPEDVDLFNSRVLKGLQTPDGVDLGESPYIDKAIAIVDTNHARQMLNFHKTRAAAARANQPLVLCAARDSIKDNDMDACTRNELLNMEISSHSKSDFLPGFIPCYVGMKVILRQKNLSTELGITNGAQGIIRQMQIDTDSYGHSFCTAALVEFTECSVEIPDLPEKWVPILPRSCRFKVQLSHSDDQVWVTRTQLPISPAFAVTGHSSQGKTLPVVITNLKSGGFAGYVAASRPTTRYGLVITEPVTLEDLNKPLPVDLRDEYDRLHALEHNTLVKFGFLPGPAVPVPDAEGETATSQALSFYRSRDRTADRGKRKRGDHPPKPDTPNKRLRAEDSPVCSAITPGKELPGPLWDKENWSCAYDAFLPSIMAHLYHTPQSTILPHLRTTLGESFTNTLVQFSSHWEQLSCAHLTRLRDHLRDVLSEWRPRLFPRNGQVMISASHLFELLLPVPGIEFFDGGSFTLPQLLYLSPENQGKQGELVDLQCWLSHRLPSRTGMRPASLPALLQFEVVPPLCVNIPMTLTLFETEYSLSAAVYHGDGHYVSHFQIEGVWFAHDGIACDGRAVSQPGFAGSIGPNGKSIHLVTYHCNALR